MGKKSRDKGYRGERSLVLALREMGIQVERIPLSGAAPGTHGDINIDGLGVCEVKNQEQLSAKLWEWLDGVEALFIKRNRKPYLVIMRLEDWGRIWKR